MAMQDSDNLIVGRGNASYKISYEDFVDGLPTPVPPVPPLQVTKGVITPDTGVKEGDDLTGSATVIDGVNPIVVHCWEQDGVETVGTNHYTAQVGTIRYRQKVTDDNNVDPVVGEWSDPVVAEEIPPEPDTPNADMNGLRFDSARKTYLQNGNRAGSTFTFSCWSKLTSSSNTKILLGGQGSAYLNIVGDVYSFNGSAFSGSPKATLNKWQHVCAVFTGEGATLYLDGVESGTSSSTSRFDGILIGSNGSGTQVNNGYLSDCYFVDGKIAPATTFGKYFPGDKWGPLDNTAVKQNLDALQPADPTPDPGPGDTGEQPYDSRANTDQVWSSGATTGFRSGFEFSNGFDGGNSTYAIADTGDVWNAASGTLSSPVSATKTITLLTTEQWGQTAYKFGINNDSVSAYTFTTEPCLRGDGNNGTAIIITGVDTLTSIQCGNAAGLTGVEVDGRLLVDQGVWDNSQNWSDNASYSGSTYPVTQLFNGVFGGDGFPNAVDLKIGTVTFDPPLSYSSSFGIYANGGNMTININGAGSESIGSPSNDGSLVPVKTGSGTISSITGSATGLAAWLYGLNIDGKKLVDAGAQWNTSKTWSQGLSGGRDSSTPQNAFDGDLGTGYTADASEVVALEFSEPLNGKVRIAAIAASNVTLNVSVNDGAAESISLPTDSFPAQYVDLGDFTNITKISAVGIGNSWNLCGFEINNQVLVDATAVWDTSQIWSSGIDGPMSAGAPASNAFDGDLTTRAYTDGSPVPNEATFNFNSAVSVNSELAIYVGTGNNGVFAPLKVNGTDVASQLPASGSSSGEWVTLTGISSLSSISISRTEPATYVSLSAVKVDGAILVDGATPWNSSQVWSDGAVGSFYPDQGPTNLFDGSQDTIANVLGANPVNTGTFTLPSPIAITSSLSFYGNVESACPTDSKLIVTYTDDTTERISTTDTGFGWYSLPGAVGKSLKSFSYKGPQTGVNNTNNYYSLVKVDGALLVDAGFGSNGFYLPFDPAQTGANYSSKLTTNGTWNPGVGPENAFNGNTSTGSRAETSDGTLITFDLSSNPVAIGSSLKVMVGSNGAAGGTMTLNGNANTAVSFTNSYTEYTVPLDSETQLSTLTFNADSGSFVVYIKVDDSLLVDHTSIGVDMSGNKNNFHDQDFGVGDNVSNKWIEDYTQVGDTLSGSIYDAFNGDRSTGFVLKADSTANYIRFDSLSVANSSGKTLRVWTSKSTTVTATCSVNDAAGVTINNKSGETYLDIPLTSDLNSIQFNVTGSGSASDGVAFRKLSVGGEVLYLPPYLDTVLDTPMKNYAVLNGGKNGNLSIPATESYYSNIGVTGKVYAELIASGGTDGARASVTNDGGGALALLVGTNDFAAGDVVGIAVDETTGKVDWYVNGVFLADNTVVTTAGVKIGGKGGDTGTVALNYGQQPFVQTPPAGFEGLYQTWSEYARSTIGYALDRIADLERLRLEDSKTIATLRSDLTGALSRIASIESDEVNDDAVDNSLITLVGSLSSQITTWQTRIETAEAALAAAVDRITTLENN